MEMRLLILQGPYRATSFGKCKLFGGDILEVEFPKRRLSFLCNELAVRYNAEQGVYEGDLSVSNECKKEMYHEGRLVMNDGRRMTLDDAMLRCVAFDADRGVNRISCGEDCSVVLGKEAATKLSEFITSR